MPRRLPPRHRCLTISVPAQPRREPPAAGSTHTERSPALLKFALIGLFPVPLPRHTATRAPPPACGNASVDAVAVGSGGMVMRSMCWRQLRYYRVVLSDLMPNLPTGVSPCIDCGFCLPDPSASNFTSVARRRKSAFETNRRTRRYRPRVQRLILSVPGSALPRKRYIEPPIQLRRAKV